ncbi:MAG: hypothetical protein ACK5PB_09930 [Pirellula sp.]
MRVLRFFVNWLVGTVMAAVLVSLLYPSVVGWNNNRTILGRIMGHETSSDVALRIEFISLIVCLGLVVAILDFVIEVRKLRRGEGDVSTN